ncbi:hypothetical protein ABEY05_06295 [Bacillus subtilis]|uniref:hypothetical protein n=1 Tax=Bacillus sp. SG20033 TaxID=3366583 RepID=UPI0037CC33ED
MWYRNIRPNSYSCSNYARHGKKACSANTIKEDFLKETILYDIKKLVKEIDKEQYLKVLEAKSKKSKKDIQQKLDKLNKQMVYKKYENRNSSICLLMKKSRHDEYLEMVEDTIMNLLSLRKRKMKCSQCLKVSK